MSALTDLFTDIANAIRGKTGNSEQIAAANFAAAIGGLPIPSYVTQTITPGGDATFANELPFTNLAGKKNFVLIYGGSFDETFNPLANDQNGSASVCVLINGVCNFAIIKGNGGIQTDNTWQQNSLAISSDGTISGSMWYSRYQYTAVGW
jgi:hypothetical protein